MSGVRDQRWVSSLSQVRVKKLSILLLWAVAGGLADPNLQGTLKLGSVCEAQTNRQTGGSFLLKAGTPFLLLLRMA